MRAQRPVATSGSREERVRSAPPNGRSGDAPALGGGAGRSPGEVLALQRTVGNRAASRMIERDEHEHGAGCGHDTPAVQRSTVHEVLRGGGRPLDEATRVDMEARLGSDFSDVRVHDDTAARVSAAELGARAYTSGNHVVLGEGGGDRHTLAHELTHVIQQRLGPVAGTDDGTGLRVSDPDDRFEREAEATAHRALTTDVPAQADPATVELPSLAGPGAQTPVQRLPKAVRTKTTDQTGPYSGRATRSRSKPEADLNAPRLTFTSAYDGPSTQRLDTRQSIGFTQAATLHRPDNAALSAATLYDFRQEVTDEFVAYTVDEDGAVGSPQHEGRPWAQDGPYRPNYTNPVIQTSPAAIVFNDDPGFSTTSAIGEGSWLARYEVRFRWRVRRRDAESQTWVSSPEMRHSLTSDFDPENPPQSGAIDHAAAGDHEWDVSL
ncbi:eCIS core domain-containing protein [Micromonospora okii]|uniref:eCIS core domain-containing protein n=1 Tax=Micromonospora okii TaxID=1182970 RepID=UPI001E60BBF2|nr:DUF4157 domain-containing protein [Micromonospora okii]